jgi:hypothetical protein
MKHNPTDFKHKAVSHTGGMQMKNTIARSVALSFLLLQLWNGIVINGQTTQQPVKVGKRDDITITSVTKVGNITLQPGHYILQHRVSHGKHAVYFVKFIPYGGGRPVKGRPYYPTGSEGTSQAGDQECKLEPLPTKAKHTHVFFVDDYGAQRITRIEIKGENVAHVF